LTKVCFVICPIGQPGSDTRVAADDFMKYIVAPCAEELGYDTPIRADGLPEPGRITSQIIGLLNSADLVIADLSGDNANVYYELSCRHAIGRPAIHTAVEGTRLPFDVADNRTIFYTMHASRVERAREELAKQIKRVEQPGYKASNPILDALGLITLEKSAEPMQQAIASLARQMANLQGDIGDLRSSLVFQTVLSSVQTGYNPIAAGIGSLGLAAGKTNMLAALAGTRNDQIHGTAPGGAALKRTKAKKGTEPPLNG
jgi:hypothetical protein